MVMSIIDIIKIVGAMAAVVGTSFTILNSKRIILRKIERKENRIREIDHKQVLLYGLQRGSIHPYTNLDRKKERLNNQIENLRRLI